METENTECYKTGDNIHPAAYGISSFGLKVMAVVTMLIDHIGIVIGEGHTGPYLIMRSIGRLSFPIYCFLLVEGFIHTKDRKKHAIRLAIFAIISELPYDLFHGEWIDFSRQNVIIGLFIGYMTIWGLDYILKHPVKFAEDKSFIVAIGIVILGFAAAYFSKVTYSYGGILLICGFYVFRDKEWGVNFTNATFNIGLHRIGVQWIGVLSIIPIGMYNGTLGKHKMKYFFYWFYPLHLLALGFIKMLIVKKL